MKKLFLLPLAAVFALSAIGLTACSDPQPSAPPPAPPEPTCEHSSHDPDTLICDECGEYVVHNYVDGECTMCGAKTSFIETFITSTAWVNECDEKGTIDTIEYDTHAYSFEDYYDRNDLTMKKKMNVYVPYGYDAEDTETKYNVLILMHGGGETQDFWFGLGNYSKRDTVQTVPMLDNMMKAGIAEKTIVVTPTFSCDYVGEDMKSYNTIYREDNYYFTHNFYKELENDILPLIAERYNTYAESGEKEDLIAARDHCGMVGLSMGSAATYLSGWRYLLPYMSYFGHYSTGATRNGILSEEDIDAIIENLNGDYSEYKINYWFNQGGTADADRVAIQIQTMKLIMEGVTDKTMFRYGSNFENGDNVDFIWSIGAAHDYNCWLTGLYNSLNVFFKCA